MTQLAKKVLQNSFYNTLRALISGFGGFAFSVVLARLLTPKLFGTYALATSICFFILQLDPGTGDTATRYISYALGKNDISLARSYFKFIFKIRIFLGIFFSLLLAGSSFFLAHVIFNKAILFIPLEILSIFLFFYYISSFIDFCCIAFHNFKYPTIRSLIYECSRFIFVLIFILNGFYNGIYIGLSLASILTFIIIFYIFSSEYSYMFGKKIKNIDKKRLLRFMLFLSIGSLSWVVFSYIDMMMIGIFLPVEYAGYYKVATNIVYSVCGLTGLTSVLFPVFTQLEGESLEHAFRRVFRYACTVAFPFSFSIAFFSEKIVEVIYGSNYSPSAVALAVLTPVIITNSINFFGTILTAKEKPEFTTAISILSMVTNVILNYILIPIYGIVGASFATSFSRILNLVAMSMMLKRVVGISPDISSVLRPTFSSILMIILFYILPRPKSIYSGILEIILGYIIYLLTMFVLKGLTREDIYYFKVLLR